MEKSKLYTGGGDKGMTSLVGGERVEKDCLRLDAYGTIDEFSAFLGVLASSDECAGEICSMLNDIQNRLFDIGGYLASRPGADTGLPPVACLPECCEELELKIDLYDNITPKVHAFVLPGGCMAASQAHVARTVCRRAERRIIALSRIEDVDPNVIRYFNRLSDLLFIIARYLNHKSGMEEIIWHPNNK